MASRVAWVEGKGLKFNVVGECGVRWASRDARH